MKVSKVEAARRQLDVASTLFVLQDDRLALHTLCGAAEEILGAILVRAAQQGMFQRMKVVAEERFGKTLTDNEFSRLINKSKNALKHANDPSEDPFEYDPDDAVVMLFRALVNYQLVTGNLTDPMERALAALYREHPRLFPQ